MNIMQAPLGFERVFIDENDSFFDNLKFIIQQLDIVNREIFRRIDKNTYNGIFFIQPTNSLHTIFLNISEINFDSRNPFEIQRTQFTDSNPEGHEIDLTYEYDQVCQAVKLQYIEWWEKSIKEFIRNKYGNFKSASSLSNFARHTRNSFAHGEVDIRDSEDYPDPIWNSLNLKERIGENLLHILRPADIINFWIDFENDELTV